MRSVLVYLIAGVIAVVGVAVGFPELWRPTDLQASAELPQPAPPVVVAPVAHAPFVAPLLALGTVLANESIAITANRTEQVAALHFDDGEAVERGQLLVELESAEEQAMLAEARAILAERRAEHERTVDLAEREIAAQSDLDRTHAALLAAEARVASLEATMADLVVRAPFAGTLGLRHVSVGALVQPQTVMTTLDDLTVVKVDFTVPGTRLGDVAAGMAVVVRSDTWPEQAFAGTVIAVDTRLDDRSRSATVRAKVPNPDLLLRPGMLVKVAVDRGEAPVLQIPEEAVVPVGDEHFVFLVDQESHAARTAVVIGRRRVGFVEIRSGLETGDRVIVDGVVRVRPGAAVTVVAERNTGS